MKYIIALSLIILSFAPMTGTKGARHIPQGATCTPTYPGGAGTWTHPDGCWYLHTIPEFDASPAECQACHNGTDAAEW